MGQPRIVADGRVEVEGIEVGLREVGIAERVRLKVGSGTV